jgi:hypothetical protein
VSHASHVCETFLQKKDPSFTLFGVQIVPFCVVMHNVGGYENAVRLRRQGDIQNHRRGRGDRVLSMPV